MYFRSFPSAASAAAEMLLLLLFTAAALANAAEEDGVRCLRGIKDSLGDPDGRLNWNFGNSSSAGYVCNFLGVSCWNAQENRVLSISLPSMFLTGSVPSALQFCKTATTLVLSSNSISGQIPSQLCDWLPYLVNLDLSNNGLSGPIPPELSSCKYLNTLYLNGNSLSGNIPQSLARLDRLKKISMANNQLSGQIPSGFTQFDSFTFEGNAGLCGKPLSSCGRRSLARTSLIIIVAAGVFGAAASLLLAYAIFRFCFSSAAGKKGNLLTSTAVTARGGDSGRSWADRLRTSRNRLVPVSLFQKPIVKMKVADLLAATGDFDSSCIVVAGSSRTGTLYKAVLCDGSVLTVKRLHGCVLMEKQFRAEMARLGQLRHPNLVPVLGFCVVEDERLLIYKNMPNGALSTKFGDDSSVLDWSARLRIAVGAARGLAWLHHGLQMPYLHQSFTSATVLLDEDNEPRITDFGVAKLVKPFSSAEDGLHASPFMNGDFGEFGYIAQEYASNPVPTMKGDVYSFGVVLLEIVTGQKPTGVSSDAAGEGFKGNLVDWVNQLHTAGRTNDAIDSTLRGKGHENEILQVLMVARSCVAARPKERPSLCKVYQFLKNIGAYDFSDDFDEFPLKFSKDDAEIV